MIHWTSAAIATAVAFGALSMANSSYAQVQPNAPSDLVTLVSDATLCPSGNSNRLGLRVFPDGSEAPFSIPAGLVLIITDWQWGPVFTREANHWEIAELTLETPQRSVATVAVSGNTTPGAQATSNSNQFTGSNPSVHGMIAVKPGVTVCMSSSSDVRARAIVHGFLMQDR
jgi:hypothetical protein